MNQAESDPRPKCTYKDLNLEDLLTYSYCILDDIYKSVRHMVKRPGPAADFSDSETICLNLLGQMFCDSEKSWHGFIKKNYLHLFPKLPERSRYHRRCKDLRQITEVIRYKMLNFMDVHLQQWHIVDSMPVPVCGYSRASRNTRFAAEFGVDDAGLYGRCAAKKEDFYGFKLHLMATTQGIPTNYVLAPASHHDVTVAPELLETYKHKITAIFDKGYVGLEKKVSNPDNYTMIIQKRANQGQNTKTEKAFLGIFRKTIETTNSILAGQFNLQYTRAKSAWGLTGRITAKLTALTFAIYINFIAQNPPLQVKGLIF